MTESRSSRQARVATWVIAAFTEEQAKSLPQRGVRLAEEAIELAQAAGTPAAMLHRLIDHVYSRPVGTVRQEMGGVGVTLLAFAAAAGEDADECEDTEFARVLAKPIEHFHRRNKEKNDAGFAAFCPVVKPNDATRFWQEAKVGAFSSVVGAPIVLTSGGRYVGQIALHGFGNPDQPFDKAAYLNACQALCDALNRVA
jgi:hypothetical protein